MPSMNFLYWVFSDFNLSLDNFLLSLHYHLHYFCASVISLVCLMMMSSVQISFSSDFAVIQVFQLDHVICLINSVCLCVFYLITVIVLIQHTLQKMHATP